MLMRRLRKRKKPIFWALMVAFVIGTIFLSWGMRAERRFRAENPIYASVDGEEITRREVELSRQRIVDRLKSQYEDFDESQIPDLYERAVEEAVKRKLLFAEAEKRGMEISEHEIIQTIRLSFPDDATYQQARKRWHAKFWRWKEREVADELLISRMESLITDAAEPTEEEVREFFEENYKRADVSHILIDPKNYVSETRTVEYYNEFKEDFKRPGDIRCRHILVKVGRNATEEEDRKKRERIESILQQLKAGADFAELAKKNSDCPSAVRGGDLGFFGQGVMAPEFEKVAFTLDVGEMSGIVKTEFGYHIIKCEEKKEPVQQEFWEVEDEIRELLSNEEEALESAKKRAEEIAEKIRAGTTTFERAVRLYSDGKFSKRRKGRLGTIPKSLLPPQGTETRWLFSRLNEEIALGRMIAPEFSSATFSLREGEISDPVKTSFGFHIIRVNRFLPPAEDRFRDEYSEIKRFAASKKKSLFLKEWYDWLKREYNVKMASESG
jgi:parvulin-like peptidyl-prolyl isomerase